MDLKEEVKKICEKLQLNIDFSSENWRMDFIEKADWEAVSCYQLLSLNFCKVFSDNLNWCQISFYQRGEFYDEIMELWPHMKSAMPFHRQSSN